MPSKELSFEKNVAFSAIGGVCGAAAVYPLDCACADLCMEPNPHATTPARARATRPWLTVRSVFRLPVVKTQLQSGAHGAASPLDVARKTFRASGIGGFYRGLPANMIGIMPEKTIKLCANDVFRQKFGVDQPGGASLPLEMLAGGLAGGFQIIVTTPMEMCKIQMQLGGEALGPLVSRLGLSGMYQGTFATGMRDVPFSMIYFGLYGIMRRELADKQTNKVSTLSALMAATVAGSIGAGLTTPLDVIKTRAQATGADASEGFAQIARRVASTEGASALWFGLLPRVCIISPLFGACSSSFSRISNPAPQKCTLGGCEVLTGDGVRLACGLCARVAQASHSWSRRRSHALLDERQTLLAISLSRPSFLLCGRHTRTADRRQRTQILGQRPGSIAHSAHTAPA